MKKATYITKKAWYKNDMVIREAIERFIAVDVIVQYARGLHANADVVADLKFGHEADSVDYSDDEFAALGGKVTQYMNEVIESTGRTHYQAMRSGVYTAFSDFNGWYLEQIVYGGAEFDSALREYIQISPYIAQQDSLGSQF